MKGKTWFTLVVFLCLTAFQVQIPLSIQILGAWIGPDYLEGADRTIAYKMDFLPLGKVYIKMVSSNGRIEKFGASYTIDKQTNTIHIDGRLLMEFQATVTSNQLQVTSSRYGIPPDGLYFRTLASRSIYCLFFIGLVFLICLFCANRKGHKKLGHLI